MTDSVDRRTVLKTLAGATAAAGLAGSGDPAEAFTGLTYGPPQPFTFETLKELA